MAALFAVVFVPFLHIVQAANGPFLTSLSSNQWMIGNDIWNMTQGPKYGTKLFYKGQDCVGNAVGHYVSYSSFSPSSTCFWYLMTELSPRWRRK